MAGRKVSGNILKRSVINLIGKGPRAGMDATVYGEDTCILTASGTSIGEGSAGWPLAVYRAANNIWAAGGALMGFESCFLLKEGFEEQNLKALTRAVIQAAADCGAPLKGGNTQWSSALNENCLTVTAVGQACEPQNPGRIRPGMDIVMTKWAGLEGIWLLMQEPESRQQILDRFPKGYTAVTERFGQWLTIRHEAETGRLAGAVYMHDLSSQGVFGGLWELAEGGRCGITVNLKRIPMLQEIIELCALKDLDPYKIHSSGSLLLVGDGKAILQAMQAEEIPACIIGTITDSNDKLIINDEEIRHLDRC